MLYACMYVRIHVSVFLCMHKYIFVRMRYRLRAYRQCALGERNYERRAHARCVISDRVRMIKYSTIRV